MMSDDQISQEMVTRTYSVNTVDHASLMAVRRAGDAVL